MKNVKFDCALSFYMLRKVFSHFFSKKILGLSKAIWVFVSPYLVMENLSVPSISIERSLLSRINRKYVMLMTFSVIKKLSLEIL